MGGGSSVHTHWDISAAHNKCPHLKETLPLPLYTVTWTQPVT